MIQFKLKLSIVPIQNLINSAVTKIWQSRNSLARV